MPHTLRTLSLRCAARSQPLLGGQGAAPSPGTSPARAREPPGPFGCGARGAQHRLGMSTAQQPCSPWHTPHGDPSPSPSPRPHLGLLPKTWEEPVQGGCRGGAQAPCTPWLQGADPWSRSPVVQSITSTTSTTTPALPAGNTCTGRSERGNPPPVPSRREEALPGPTMAASRRLCLRFLAVQHRGPVARHGPARQGCAGGTRELAGALVAGTGRCHARTFPRWDLPGSAGIPAQDPAGSSPGLVPGRRPQALFAPQAVVFPDPGCRRCQETPAPPRCSSAMSQEVFLPPGPAGCRAPAGSCHLRPAAGTLVPPQPRGPGGPHAARPVLHCPALLSSRLRSSSATMAKHQAHSAECMELPRLR